MKIKKISIHNYRQFHKTTINLDENITMLAGPNNSGKTSLVEFLKVVFNGDKISTVDFPAQKNDDWLCGNFKKIDEILLSSTSENDFSTMLTQYVLSVEFNYDSMLAEIEVSYKDDEVISRFSEYLMDLDEDKSSFYFVFKYVSNRPLYLKSILLQYDSLSSKFKNYRAATSDNSRKKAKDSIKLVLMNIFFSSMQREYGFSDSSYKSNVKMEASNFIRLFNLHYIKANRPIDDEKFDRQKSVSNKMIEYISKDPEWKKLKDELPDKLIAPIKESNIESTIQEKSLKPIKNILDSVSNTDGGATENIAIGLNLTDEGLRNTLGNVMSAFYEIDGLSFKENSQGLGYNNMIYMHLQLQEYILNIDNSVINLFVIEEPESHMHPQMQRTFTKYLEEYYKEIGIQGLVTTHASEIVKSSTIDKLRIVRKLSNLRSYVFDMDIFIRDQKASKVLTEDKGVFLNEFYNMFFTINFSDIIFADKVIFYEGDTERMYIRKVLELDKFKKSRKQYIAFVQVGGAYAHNYYELIKFLNIKSVIFTDIDYDKKLRAIADIEKSTSTNATLNFFYKHFRNTKSNPKTRSLYTYFDNKRRESNIVLIKFQGVKDGYARTLEEAMLNKYFKINIENQALRKTWQKRRKTSLLRFSIPKNGGRINVRKIVDSTSGSKTDFMYSVIMNKLIDETLPVYIEEGLKWLL